MEQNQINPVGSIQPRKSKLWRFFLGLVGIVVFTLVLLVVLGQYRRWAGQQRIQQLAEAMDKAQKDEYAREMADTYGGKTPQETLAMYISAVEKKDYVLASKYYVINQQDRELKAFNNIGNLPVGRMESYITTLKSVLTKAGQYSYDKKFFSYEDPVAIDLTLYPNGIWKLKGI